MILLGIYVAFSQYGSGTMIDAAERGGSRAPWKSMIESYLSIERCDGADRGCPIAALAPDIARTPPAMKQRMSAAILKFREGLIPLMPGRTSEERSSNFLMIITTMVGTIAIARTMPELAVRQAILNTVRDRLLASY